MNELLKEAEQLAATDGDYDVFPYLLKIRACNPRERSALLKFLLRVMDLHLNRILADGLH